MKSKITIFTDGAAKGNPGPGGWGAVIAYPDRVLEIGGHKALTTNNEMELKAIVEALKVVANESAVASVYTDSKYAVEGATGWIFGWLKNDWMTKAKTPVANLALWQELLPLLRQVKIDWHKVPGHVGIAGNERVDAIASSFAERGTFDLYDGSKSGYGVDVENTTYDESKSAARSAQRERQNQKAYSYVSLLQGEIKIHQTWAECEARVKGQKGARFKKALSQADEAELVKSYQAQA